MSPYELISVYKVRLKVFIFFNCLRTINLWMVCMSILAPTVVGTELLSCMCNKEIF